MLKKFILFLSSIIIIFVSFVIPKILFQIEDLSREKEIFEIPKNERKIDVQAEKIYLVRFIHDIYEIKDKKLRYYDDKTVSVSVPITKHIRNTSLTDENKNEILKLVSSEIIKDLNFDEFAEYYETENIFSTEYIVITAILLPENGDEIEIGIEEKTGKIISINFPKDVLRSDVDKRRQLESYAKYLDLDIIGDWKYENQVLKSEKAQLSIFFEEKENGCMLTIAPTDVYAEYEKFEYEYEIIEKQK